MKFIYPILLILFTLNVANAQIAVNTDNSTASANAILDVKSTTKGFLTPRMTTTQREMISSPATGLLVYDLTSSSFWFHNGSAWDELVHAVEKKLEDTDGDTKIQMEESMDEDIIRFDLAGTESMVLRKNSATTAGPILELKGANGNTFVGESTGTATSAADNTFLGFEAGKNNIAGSKNIFIGSRAGANNQGGIDNTFIGNYAGSGQSSGNQNVYIGHIAGQLKTAGSQNVLLGAGTGRNAGAGSGNVFIGFQAGQNETGSNKLYIANSNTSSPLIYGDFNTNTLQFNGDLSCSKLITLGQWISYSGNNDGIFIHSSNKIGIGTNNPAHGLDVNGAMKITGDIKFRYSAAYNPVAYDRAVTVITVTVNVGGGLNSSSTNSVFLNGITKTGTGTYVINFDAGTFVDEPIAIITAFKQSNSDDNLYGHLTSITTSSISLSIRNSGGNLKDGPFNVLLVGER